MERVILHSDMNNCYASIELLYRPALRGRPLAVAGDPEARHGIVLAKDQLAKKAGVKTGMALWQAKQLCPEIVFVPPDMDRYIRFSHMAREIYAEYTDMQEAFGLDESWLDVTGSASGPEDGAYIAEEIRGRIKEELGVTVSVGVSWNKIFAKFGSDYKKPDAVTVITRDNYKEIVWKQPADDLLCVGRATKRKLYSIGIRTIGEIAEADPRVLQRLLGKMGLELSVFANGADPTPVSREDFKAPVKSIGNGTTTPRDMTTDRDACVVIYNLAESVSARLREHGLKCRTVDLYIRDKDLYSFTRQKKLRFATDITNEIAAAAAELFRANYDWEKPVRSLAVRGTDLVPASAPEQLDLFTDQGRREKLHRMDLTVDDIRRRFGFQSIRRGMMYEERGLTGLDAKGEHTVHPRGYFGKRA